ncbi:MAG: hypothetical protein KGJ23_01500 [Euryarchaeota archaeon]|nr:hypothetical protein [Euryarchaeota archaeon]MDE2043566.1 hypothetical protein [Thermoplasmata archaeon]
MNADSRKVNTVGERSAGNPPAPFDGGAVETQHGSPSVAEDSHVGELRNNAKNAERATALPY